MQFPESVGCVKVSLRSLRQSLASPLRLACHLGSPRLRAGMSPSTIFTVSPAPLARFFCFPSSVSFEVTGASGPTPFGLSRALAIPCFPTRACTTALARSWESLMLLPRHRRCRCGRPHSILSPGSVLKSFAISAMLPGPIQLDHDLPVSK